MESQTIRLCTSYLEQAFDPAASRKIIRRLRHGYSDEIYKYDEASRRRKAFKQKIEPIKFDTLVGTGLSGALLLPKVAQALKVNYLIVRKESDGSHSSNLAEGNLGSRWLFFDDLIDGGSTFNRVYNAVNKITERHNDNLHKYYRYLDQSDHQTEFVGSYLYNDNLFFTPDEMLKQWGRNLHFHPVNIAEQTRIAEQERIERDRQIAEYEQQRREQRERYMQQMQSEMVDSVAYSTVVWNTNQVG